MTIDPNARPKMNAKPKIDYPCKWDYKLIGRDEHRIRRAALAVVQDMEHTLTLSNTSSGGKYKSLLLAVTVKDEAQRNAIFAALKKHEDILMVL